jgi:virginiamycin B lyase
VALSSCAATLSLVALLAAGHPALAAVTITEYPVPTGNSPGLIAPGPDGNLWFTENAANNVAKVTTSGSFTEYAVPTGASKPIGIVAGPDHNLWFTENNAHKVGTVTTSGAFTEYATTGFTSFITAGPDGNLWFTEGSSNLVAKVTTSGAVTEYTVPTPNGYPGWIAKGPDGNLWFTESGPSPNTSVWKVAKVTTSGAFTEYTVPTASSSPFGITAGPDGNLWFTEYNAGKLAKVSTSGAFTEYPIPTAGSHPFVIAAGSDGNLWFTENSANNVASATTSGVVTEYPVPTAASGPVGITTGPDGNIWFTEVSANKVAKITPPAVSCSAGQTRAESPCESLLADPHPAAHASVEAGQTMTIVYTDDVRIGTGSQAPSAVLSNGKTLPITVTPTSGKPQHYVDDNGGSKKTTYQDTLAFSLPRTLAGGSWFITVTAHDSDGETDQWNWPVVVGDPDIPTRLS